MVCRIKRGSVVAFAVASLAASAASATEQQVQISKCQASYGSVAITDGDTQGWTKFGLGSPRELIGAMVRESGCFTVHDPASGKPANFLMSAIAGSKEEVDQSVNMAKAAFTEGALRTGALGAAGNVPFAGAALRMFGGFGGKKKSVSAGLRMLSPTTGQTLIASTGEAQKTSLEWGYAGQYGGSADGKMLTSAFVTAYNSLVAQAGALPKAQ